MISDSLSYEKFEKLIAELFKLLGKKDVVTNIIDTYLIDHEYEIDILFGSKSDLSIAEVKSYRPEYPPNINQFQKALKSISDKKVYSGAHNALLVVSCELSDLLRDVAKKYKEIVIWDIKDVFKHSQPFPDLYKELSLTIEVAPSRLAQIDNEKIELDENSPSAKQEGRELIEALLKIKPGRDMAYEYESICIHTLKYIFQTNLLGWHEQHETIDGLNRRDLICRVLPNADVWKFILSDLQSRYIVFEFKNYSKPITQKEVITTERYLYPTALRKVAIIIAHNGCSASAEKVMEGAMREHGKLIIVLSNENLIKLINMKDNGSDPNTFIFDIIDQFLMGLGR